MADNITIIRLEISDSGQSTTGNTNSTTPGSLAAGAAAGSISGGKLKKALYPFGSGSSLDEKVQSVKARNELVESWKGEYPKAHENMTINAVGRVEPEVRRAYSAMRMNSAKGFLRQGSFKHAWTYGVDSMRNLESSDYMRMGKKTSLGIVGVTAAATNIYSQHKTVGYNLSGATHAAQTQQRKQSIVNTATSLVGAAIINPWLAAGMIAHKAYQLAQTNRQELYQIKSSQIISGILQERLVKDTIQRRF